MYDLMYTKVYTRRYAGEGNHCNRRCLRSLKALGPIGTSSEREIGRERVRLRLKESESEDLCAWKRACMWEKLFLCKGVYVVSGL